MKSLEKLKEDDEKYIAHTYHRMDIDIDYMDGSYIVDKSNNKYLDMFSGIGVNNFGGRNDKLINALISQASKVTHLSNHFYSEQAIELAKKLVENSFAEKVFFTNSGTESNEAAIKLCVKYGKTYSPHKTTILTAYNSFHGRTMGSLSLTGQSKYQDTFSPLLPNVKYFNYNDKQSFVECLSDDICAVFIELIQGEGGVIEIDREFLDNIIENSKRYNFLVVVDEVQTGLGRTGDLFAYQGFGIEPDVVTLAKSLGGGLPLGAVLMSDKCANIFSYGDHGSTFAPNSVSAACANVVMETLLDDEFMYGIKVKSKYLFDELNNLRNKYPFIIKGVVGKGLMVGIKVGDYAQQIKESALKNMLLLNVTAKDTIRLLPPLNISIEDISLFLELFEKSLMFGDLVL